MYRYIPQKKRSRLRILAGRLFYTLLRYLFWLKNRGCFAVREKISSTSADTKDQFPYCAAHHDTPLFRQLSDMDILLQQNKVHNLKIAVARISGTVVRPGEVFSYWKLIGAPVRIRGFKKGVVLVNGMETAKTGGGLCQLSNLIYWMTLHTPLSVIERFRHSYDVFPDQNRTQPFGSGATCVYNYRDLQIRNETDFPYIIKLSVQDGRLWGRWCTNTPCVDEYEIYEKSHWITQEMAGVYVRHNILCRRHYKIRNDGHRTLIDDLEITENNALMMYSPLISAPKSFTETSTDVLCTFQEFAK